MELIDDVQKLCLIKFLHQKHQLTEFHNLLFVCKRWNKIIFENKLYIGNATKSKIICYDIMKYIKYHLKDLFITTNANEHKIFIDIKIKYNCAVLTYDAKQFDNSHKYFFLDVTCNRHNRCGMISQIIGIIIILIELIMIMKKIINSFNM